MHVSFVIPLYNCLDLTRAMLASLRATLPEGIEQEIILVDDGSTDGTREWLGTLSGEPFRVLLNPANLGYAGANNRGAALARGDLLCLLNNDLVLTPGWLEPMLALQRSLPAPGAIGNVQLNARTGDVDHAGIFINAKGKPQHDADAGSSRARVRRAPAVTGACLLIARDLWNQLGGFDEGFLNGGEDVDLCLRARSAGRENAVALRSVIRHHVSASPGRKRRDEANSRRLTLRWRDQLAELGARAWCRHYVECELNSALAFRAPLASWRIYAYAHGLTRTCPAEARAGITAAIDRELARWNELLGPVEGASTASARPTP